MMKYMLCLMISFLIVSKGHTEQWEGVDKMSDSLIVYETIAREGQTFDQYLVVAHSIKNRVSLGWYSSPREACLAPYQYSSWLKSEHEMQTERSPKELSDARMAWNLVNRPNASDDFPVTHFYTGNKKPSWADKTKYLCSVDGMHCHQEVR